MHFAWINFLEFFLWLGVPLALLTLSRLRRALLGLLDGDLTGLTLPAASLALVLIYLGFFSQTCGETARLWLPLVPICCALAAYELTSSGKRFAQFAGIVVGLQWLTILFTKTGQDFW